MTPAHSLSQRGREQDKQHTHNTEKEAETGATTPPVSVALSQRVQCERHRKSGRERERRGEEKGRHPFSSPLLLSGCNPQHHQEEKGRERGHMTIWTVPYCPMEGLCKQCPPHSHSHKEGESRMSNTHTAERRTQGDGGCNHPVSAALSQRVRVQCKH